MHTCICPFPSVYTEHGVRRTALHCAFLPCVCKVYTAGYRVSRCLLTPLHGWVMVYSHSPALRNVWIELWHSWLLILSLKLFLLWVQYIPLSWLSCCFSDCSQFLSFIPFPSPHTLNLTVPMPCVTSHFLPSSWGANLHHYDFRWWLLDPYR